MDRTAHVIEDRVELAPTEAAPAATSVAKSSPARGSSVTKRPTALVWAVDSDRHYFAAKVRAARAILGWSQTELARLTGLSQRSVYRLELAAVDVRRSTMVALETVFADAGITFEPLADGGFRIIVAGRSGVRQ